MAFRALLIDDDIQFKKLLERRLRSFIPDLSVLSFDNLTTTREYLRSLTKTELELVIIDEHLPDGRGAELLSEGWFEGLAVLSISSDTTPELPGAAIQAGATYFLPKSAISEALFKPLVLGIIDRNKLLRELQEAKLAHEKAETIKTMVATLRHEINNPLGAVLGAAYILRNSPDASEEQQEAADLVESSGKRIKHVLGQLCATLSLEPVSKANHRVFHIPGDTPWGEESPADKDKKKKS